MTADDREGNAVDRSRGDKRAAGDPDALTSPPSTSAWKRSGPALTLVLAAPLLAEVLPDAT